MQTRRTHTMYAIMNNKLPKTDLWKFCINSNFDVAPNRVNDCSFFVLHFFRRIYLFMCWFVGVAGAADAVAAFVYPFNIQLRIIHRICLAFVLFCRDNFTCTSTLIVFSTRILLLLQFVFVYIFTTPRWHAAACGRVQWNSVMHHTYQHHLRIVLLLGCSTTNNKKRMLTSSRSKHTFFDADKRQTFSRSVCDFRVCALFSRMTVVAGGAKHACTIEVCLVLSRWKP